MGGVGGGGDGWSRGGGDGWSRGRERWVEEVMGGVGGGGR